MAGEGALIRRLRLEQNLSQETLCRGICAASYLSKIEQGQVDAGTEIVDLLFRALGVEYCRDEALLERAGECLEAYYVDWEEEREPNRETVQWLETNRDHLRCSRWSMDLELWQLLHTCQERAAVCSRAEELERLRPVMTREQQYRYCQLRAELSQSWQSRLQWLLQAEQIHLCAWVRYWVAYCCFALGQYSRCADAAASSYQLAAEEGNSYVLIWASFLLGSCFCETDLTMARRHYLRAIRLGRDRYPELEAHACYNLGASHLEVGKLEAAEHWLSRAAELPAQPDHDLLLAQKRTLLYCRLGRSEEAWQALERAETILREHWDLFRDQPLQQSMIRFARLELEGKQLLPEYEEILQKLRLQAGEELGFGFRRFYGAYLIELYRRQRRYKEALQIAERQRLS